MELPGTDIQYIRTSLRMPNDGYLALPTVKRILRDVLLAIAYAHSRGIAHTGSLLGLLVPVLCSFFFRGLLDNRPNNTMASLSDAHITEAVTNWLEANPPRTNPPSRSMTIMVHAVVSSSDCQRTRGRKV